MRNRSVGIIVLHSQPSGSAGSIFSLGSICSLVSTSSSFAASASVSATPPTRTFTTFAFKASSADPRTQPYGLHRTLKRGELQTHGFGSCEWRCDARVRGLRHEDIGGWTPQRGENVLGKVWRCSVGEVA